MRILLDTHTWIWIATESPRLSKKMAKIAADESNVLCVSPISIWEIYMLEEKKRLGLSEGAAGFVKTAMSSGFFKEIPLTASIAAKSRELRFQHNDPADRFIAATAYLEKIPLATSDENLLELSWLKTIQ